MYFYTNFYRERNKIYLRGYEFGARFNREVECAPFLFMDSKKPTKYKNLSGQHVDRVDFESMKEMRDFMQKYEGIHNFNLYGLTQYEYVFINNEFSGEIQYDPKFISRVTLDIETAFDDTGFPDPERARHEVLVITIRKNEKSYVFSTVDYTNQDPNVIYTKCADETDLLKKFIDRWVRLDIDVITGWNVQLFDMVYIVNRILSVLGQEYVRLLSPFGKVNARTTKVSFGKEMTVYDIVGITVLDYLDLYKKFSFTPQESYTLDYVCEEELGTKKLDYSDYDDLMDLWRRNPKMYIDYNIHDVTLVDMLNNKMGLLEQAYAIAFLSKVAFADVFTTVRLWDIIVHNHLLEKNIVIPIKNYNRKERSIVGGFVQEPQTGKFDWVVSLDLDSLYPHLIMQFNISPETLYGVVDAWTFENQDQLDINVSRLIRTIDAGKFDNEDLIKTNQTMTLTGYTFNTKQKGFFPTLMEERYEKRKMFKKRMIEQQKQLEKIDKNDIEARRIIEAEISKADNMQKAIKVQLNGCYGAMSNEYFRYYDDRLAESITSSGQFVIQYIAKRLDEYMKNLFKSNTGFVIASDTDSIYLNVSDFAKYARSKKSFTDSEMSDIIDKWVNEKLLNVVKEACETIQKSLNCPSQKMNMKRECIASGIFVSKKRYALNVWNKEGVKYESPKLKIQGLEAIRSSVPKIARAGQKNAIKLMFENNLDRFHDYIEEYSNEYKKFSVYDVATPTTCNNISTYTDENGNPRLKTPEHVRAAIAYNRFLKEHSLDKKYPKLSDGQKIRYCKLKMPNPTKSNVIAFQNIPKELDIQSYIDYNGQLERDFISPLTAIAKVIGWPIERQNSLSDLFV